MIDSLKHAKRLGAARNMIGRAIAPNVNAKNTQKRSLYSRGKKLGAIGARQLGARPSRIGAPDRCNGRSHRCCSMTAARSTGKQSTRLAGSTAAGSMQRARRAARIDRTGAPSIGIDATGKQCRRHRSASIGRIDRQQWGKARHRSAPHQSDCSKARPPASIGAAPRIDRRHRSAPAPDRGTKRARIDISNRSTFVLGSFRRRRRG